tara:strand:- start:79 stop:696 length:618 start_codon:yes stop_codon:yes gene_type:complete
MIPDFTYKIILLGEPGVGKTTLCNSILHREILTMQYQPTIGIDFNCKDIVISNKKYKIYIWDTAGQERFRSIIMSYFRNTCAMFLLYDITKYLTFQKLNHWLDLYNRNNNCNHQHAIYLIGTKVDITARRQVSYIEGYEFAKEHGLMFREINTFISTDVNEVLKELVLEINNTVDKECKGIKSNNIQTLDLIIPDNSNNDKCCNN